MLSKRILTVSCALALSGLAASESSAQQLGAAAPAAAVSQSAGPAIPEQYKLDLLVRTTVVAINQANITGNYTVFRDLTAPVFQSQNSPARLAEIFSTLRKRNLDLSPVIFFPAKFQRSPAVENGLLRLTGFFPTRPEQVNFDLAYQNVNGRWLLVGVSINTAPNSAPTAAAAPGASPAAKPDATASAGAPAAAAPAPHKPAAKPKPARAQAPKPGAAAVDTAVEPKTTTNFARVDLGQPGPAPLPERRPSEGAAPAEGAAAAPAQAESKPEEGAAAAPAAEKRSVWPF